MKKILSTVRETLMLTALSDLFISLAFFLFATIQSFSSGAEAAISFSQYALILLFAFIFSLSKRILARFELKLVWRTLIHFSISAVAFIVIFVAAGKIAPTPSGIFVFCFLFTAIYAIVFFCCLLVSHLLKKYLGEPENSKEKTNEKKKESYQSMF